MGINLSGIFYDLSMKWTNYFFEKILQIETKKYSSKPEIKRARKKKKNVVKIEIKTKSRNNYLIYYIVTLCEMWIVKSIFNWPESIIFTFKNPDIYKQNH